MTLLVAGVDEAGRGPLAGPVCVAAVILDPARAIELLKMMMATTPSTRSGWPTRIVGSTSMPTDTKNSTENASRSGSDSCAARWLNSDSRMTEPAKKAPNANETLKIADAP